MLNPELDDVTIDKHNLANFYHDLPIIKYNIPVLQHYIADSRLRQHASAACSLSFLMLMAFAASIRLILELTCFPDIQHHFRNPNQHFTITDKFNNVPQLNEFGNNIPHQFHDYPNHVFANTNDNFTDLLYKSPYSNCNNVCELQSRRGYFACERQFRYYLPRLSFIRECCLAHLCSRLEDNGSGWNV